MNQIKLAMSLLPMLHVLYEAGVIDIAPSLSGDADYIQLREETFRKLFPDVEEDEKHRLVTSLVGVTVMAVVI